MSQLGLFEVLNWAARLLLAQAVIILFLILNVVSLSLPHAGDLKPFFLLMTVYYWSIYRPSVMPIAYTFVLGVLIDLLSDIQLGISSLLLISIQIIVQRSRLFLMGQPFMMVWLGFTVIAFAYAVLMWFLLSVVNISFFPKESFVEVLIAALLTTLIFPIVCMILQGVHKILPNAYNPLRVRG